MKNKKRFIHIPLVSREQFVRAEFCCGCTDWCYHAHLYTLCRKQDHVRQGYFFLCLFFLKRFLRLWVAILCLFLFFPLGIA